MIVKKHIVNGYKIAEVDSEEILINSAEDGMEILAILYYQDFDRIILLKKNITHDFFDLKNGMAGEILQKFSNYRAKLAVVGDFTSYSNKSLNYFIYESNLLSNINFNNSVSEALQCLSTK